MAVSRLGRNFLANLLGSGWGALMNLAFVPIYLRCIGAEGYGLIGAFATLSALLSFLDAGLGAAAGRELARASDSPDEQAASRDLVFTLEVLFWGLALCLGVLLLLWLPWISHYWLKSKDIPPDTMRQALSLLVAIFVVQLPQAYYQGCLSALQRQLETNLLNVASSTIRSLGAVLILYWVSPTVQAFFLWNLVSLLCTALPLRILLWRALPGSRRFRLERVRAIVGFGAEVSSVNFLVLFTTQADKLLVSSLASLGEFGLYSLAWTLVSQFFRITAAFQMSVQPRLTQLVAAGDAELRQVFRWSCRLLSLILVPGALFLAWRCRELIWLWSRDQALARSLGPLVFWLSLAVLVNSLLVPPYLLQVANGRTRIALVNNLLALVILVPLLWWSGLSHGVVGICRLLASWHCFNLLGSGCLSLHFFLRGELVYWLATWALPLAAVAATLHLLERIWPPPGTSLVLLLPYLMLTYLASLVSAKLALSVLPSR